MSRTYHASFDKRVDLIRDGWVDDDGAWVVWADPLQSPKTRSLGGPFVILVGIWGPQKELAEKIAVLLTEHALALETVGEDPTP